ncbi:MAG TPA: GDSL-type esterase/lipase family protein, partial [Patescibacteria group bacterium]|nr:GDSL-type esterase/lipase family protein [Patescibacteria group bacterium]
MSDLFIFGDSIVYGQWDEQGGWPQRLRAKIDRDFIAGTGPKRLAYILGVPGDTAADLLMRMEAEMAGRFNPSTPFAIVIALGINDAHFSTSAQKDRFTQEEFERNLGRVVGIARKYTKHILLVGLNPIDEAKVQPLPWNTEKSYSTARVRAFNAI